ncbi:MAG: glycosyltransferase family 2 protein [Chloroflexi bacterium]|nr:glycosyltransferase family 2 protein [Chloroflexota bacterium]
MIKKLDVVIPVLNEEVDLEPSTRTLHEYMSAHLDQYEWAIVIADNGSTDATLDIAGRLSREFPNVSFIRLEQRGRGRALKRAWTESKADIVAFMDVDLSTDLEALPGLIRAVDVEGYEIAIGSRLARGAVVTQRPFKRELFSRVYSLLVRASFLCGFRDAQCGFKAVTRRVADEVVPLVENTGWFFDTELLIIAEKNGYPIRELPVRWSDDLDSRVNVVRTVVEDIKGLLRMRFGGLGRASRKLAALREPS